MLREVLNANINKFSGIFHGGGILLPCNLELLRICFMLLSCDAILCSDFILLYCIIIFCCYYNLVLQCCVTCLFCKLVLNSGITLLCCKLVLKSCIALFCFNLVLCWNHIFDTLMNSVMQSTSIDLSPDAMVQSCIGVIELLSYGTRLQTLQFHFAASGR
jgi:hypothetical protein